ncbi:MAG: response regulator transcription factor [Methylococcales bacterium]|nr:response regulator transcription factor [Methylococcales bacterium]
MNGSAPAVFIVDDDLSVLKALERLLRSAGLNATTFASAQDFLDHHDRNAPGCLVLDVAMPRINGLELQQALTAQSSELPVIFLTGHGDIPMSVRAIKQGAVDFLTKPVNGSDLIEAIHNAIEKDRIARQARAKSNELQQRLATLTAREREVLSHVVSGKKNRQIAADLGTVEKTIKVHRAHLMTKLKVRSLAELVKLAEQLGVKSSLTD